MQPLPLCCWWLIFPMQNDTKKAEKWQTLAHMVLIWENSAWAFQWIPTWQGLNGSQKSLCYIALEESSQIALERFTHLDAHSSQKPTDNFPEIYLAKVMSVRRIFEGEMLFKILSTTLLQIFCKIIFDPKVFIKSIIDPDDNIQMTS